MINTRWLTACSGLFMMLLIFALPGKASAIYITQYQPGCVVTATNDPDLAYAINNGWFMAHFNITITGLAWSTLPPIDPETGVSASHFNGPHPATDYNFDIGIYGFSSGGYAIGRIGSKQFNNQIYVYYPPYMAQFPYSIDSAGVIHGTCTINYSVCYGNIDPNNTYDYYVTVEFGASYAQGPVEVGVPAPTSQVTSTSMPSIEAETWYQKTVGNVLNGASTAKKNADGTVTRKTTAWTDYVRDELFKKNEEGTYLHPHAARFLGFGMNLLDAFWVPDMGNDPSTDDQLAVGDLHDFLHAIAPGSGLAGYWRQGPVADSYGPLVGYVQGSDSGNGSILEDAVYAWVNVRDQYLSNHYTFLRTIGTGLLCYWGVMKAFHTIMWGLGLIKSVRDGAPELVPWEESPSAYGIDNEWEIPTIEQIDKERKEMEDD